MPTSPDRKRLLALRRVVDVLGRDSARLRQMVADLLDQEERRAAYRLVTDPDDPERGALARQLRALPRRQLG